VLDKEVARLEVLQCVETTEDTVFAADVIVTAIMSCLGKPGGNREQQQRQLAPLVSQDLLLVVTAGFACECEHLHARTNRASSWACDSSSSSSSSRKSLAQQPHHAQVPPYHKQLLICCGVMPSEHLTEDLQQRRSGSFQRALSMQLLQRLLPGLCLQNEQQSSSQNCWTNM
jgi:hypothetical protein